MFSPDQVLRQRYRLHQILGQTPSRQTWLALDQDSQEQVVVKLLIFGGTMEWQDLKLFERESQVLQQLDHPQIPRYRDHFSHPDAPAWFASVYSYIPGHSLKDLLDQERRFTESELRRIATDILKVLIYLHGLAPQILHRDIKPSNLIWGEDDQIYLVDFGAIQTQAPTPGKTFTVVGTYGYTPVEQYGGQAVAASDLYALGATLVHLATGQSPGDLPRKAMRLQFQDQIDFLSAVTWEPHFTYWLERLIEPAVESRLPTAKEALERLESRQIPPLRSATPVTQPGNSLIRLQRTTEFLQVIVPSTFQKFIGSDRKLAILATTEIAAMSGVLFVVIIALLAFPFLLFVLALLGYLLMSLLRETEILLTRDHLEVKHRLFDWTFFRRRVLVSEIEDIFRERVAAGQRSREDWQAFRLVLRTTYGDEFYIGTNWTGREETLWLNREINSWLNSC